LGWVSPHPLGRVIGMAHRDCGAAAVAYGDRIVSDRDYETEMLSDVLRQFRTPAAQRQPQLIVELGIMDLNGVVEPVT
jgi:hypothetical protein